MVLTTVVTSKFLGSTASHRPTVPSAYSHRVFGRPQAGILSSVAFSPDGRTLSAGATGGPKAGPRRGGKAGGTTYLWDVKTGTKIAMLSPGGGAEAFSPNGSILAAAGGPGNDTTYLWEVAARHTVAVLSDHHDSSVEGVAFSANGRTLAVNDANGTVYVWALGRGGEVPAGYHPGVLALPGGVKSDAIAFSRRGATLAMGGANGQVYLWSQAAGTVTRTLKPPGNPAAVTSVAFSPDGRALAAGENGGVTYVWDLASRARLSLPDPDGSDIESVAFSPDSRWLATGAANGKTYLWHPPAAKPFATLTNPKGPASGSSSGNHGTAVFSVAFSPGGTSLATTDPDGLAFLWKVKVR